MLFKGFPIFSSGGYFVQPSRATLEYLVEDHLSNISVKLFENLPGSRYHLKVFLFLALAAISFFGAERF